MTGVELRHFRYFIAVAEERHFGHAADRLHVAQPGVSQQIKALERTVGVSLFTRDRRGVELTEAGQEFLDHARQVIELADRAVDAARLRASGRPGLLKVGTTVSGLRPVAKRLLELFSVRYQDVELEIHPGYATDQIPALLRRELDVAIVLWPFAGIDQVSYLKLSQMELLVALPEGHRLASLDRVPRSALLEETFLDCARSANPTNHDDLLQQIFAGAAHPQRIEIPEVLDTVRLQLVAQGRGFAVPAFPPVADLGIRGVVFRRLEDPVPVMQYGLAWVRSEISPIVSAFVGMGRELAETTGRGAEGDSSPSSR